MSDRTPQKYLRDIATAISLIEEFCVEVPDFSRYSSDAKTKSAVERQLSIIGEGADKIMREDSSVSLMHAQKIVDFRNRVARSSDSIDDAIVWNIIRSHLPQLKTEVNKLLTQ